MSETNNTSRVLVIAEAGVNHNGSLELALQLVDAAAAAGADVVKFQTFVAARMISASAPKAAYQKRTTGEGESQLDMVRRLELSPAMHKALLERCAACGIEFLSTPFEGDSVDLLVGLGLRRLKVPSGEITNGPLLLKLARTGLPLIVSTGMATLDEVRMALAVLAFGYTASHDLWPDHMALAAALESVEGQAALRRSVTLLHCTTEYPAPMESVNLRAMATLAEAFGLPVGYSDHTPGITIPIAAAARGAVVIEKHFTLDRALPGPDHKASLQPDELAAMVTAIRDVEMALGDGRKQPHACEQGNAAVARKSLAARRPMTAGEALSPDNLTVLRPGTGMSPMRYWELLGRPAPRDYAEGELIEPL